MTDAFDDRRKAFEAKLAHDEELRFQVMVRRNRLLGLWAAGRKGLAGPAAEAFAESVVAADFQEPGEEDVFRKIRVELEADVSDAEIRAKMHDLLDTAIAEAKKGLA